MSEWISVKERLPEDFEWVLAVDKDRCVGEAMFSSRDGSWDGPYGEYHLYGVTHWMPMPEPPGEESEPPEIETIILPPSCATVLMWSSVLMTASRMVGLLGNSSRSSCIV